MDYPMHFFLFLADSADPDDTSFGSSMFAKVSWMRGKFNRDEKRTAFVSYTTRIGPFLFYPNF